MHDSAVAKLSETWRSRARECRAIAERFRNTGNRERMLRAAQDFERMAVKATQREGAEVDRWSAMTP
jgi:HEPN domain-containing protein